MAQSLFGCVFYFYHPLRLFRSSPFDPRGCGYINPPSSVIDRPSSKIFWIDDQSGGMVCVCEERERNILLPYRKGALLPQRKRESRTASARFRLPPKRAHSADAPISFGIISTRRFRLVGPVAAPFGGCPAALLRLESGWVGGPSESGSSIFGFCSSADFGGLWWGRCQYSHFPWVYIPPPLPGTVATATDATPDSHPGHH